MSLSIDASNRLFERGQFLRLIAESGSQRIRKNLEPAARVVVANALALAGSLDDADELALLDCRSSSPPAILAQAEWTRALVSWRRADVADAIRHARSALRAASESGDREKLAWAQLHLFRFLIERGPGDAIASALADARNCATAAGSARILAYLHNCVAVFEGQTGRFDEAKRHLDLAQSLLQSAPNSWLEGGMHMHRGSIACAECDFRSAAEHFTAAKRAGEHSGNHLSVAADTCLGYVQLLVGEYDAARRTLTSVLEDQDAAIFMKLAATDSLARVWLANGALDACSDALELIEHQVRNHPDASSVFHVRWANITRARLALKRGVPAEAFIWATKGLECAEAVGDIPLAATSDLLLAQICSLLPALGSPAPHLMSANRRGITEIRDLQALYYYVAALTVQQNKPLASDLHRRASKVWDHQAVTSLRSEVSDRKAGQTEGDIGERVSLASLTTSFASLSDLAHEPRLFAEEMIAAITALGCSPGVKLIERKSAESRTMREDAERLLLLIGVEEEHEIGLSCEIPCEADEAIVLSDVLRIGRTALSLERLRHQERGRAALWPAPPIEEQSGAIFLAKETKEILSMARRVGPTTVTVLITGETGTGKEVLARIVHAYSNRANAAFLPFNCSSVPKEMLDSQLFGHRKGSFTGAVDNFPGVIRAAAGGTLLLDEIGETTLDVQPKLLRFLESGEVHPIGETQPLKSDVRVIAATNADLDRLVADGRFREDLFYRLNIVRLHIPPLRERRVEIPTLAHHYLQKHAQEYRKGNLRIAEETMEYLVLYRWPGNVRQLANEMRRLAALAEIDAVMMPEHLSPDIAASRKTVPPSERTLEPTEIVVRIDQPMMAAVQHLERTMIQHAMKLTGNRMEETASLLGVSRKGLYLKRVRYGLEPPEGSLDGSGEVEIA